MPKLIVFFSPTKLRDGESMTEEDPIMTTFLSPKRPSSRSPKALSSPTRGDRISSPCSGRRAERKSSENDRQCRRKRLAVQWREAYLRATKMAGEGLAARKATRAENLKNSEDRPDYYEYIKAGLLMSLVISSPTEWRATLKEVVR